VPLRKQETGQSSRRNTYIKQEFHDAWALAIRSYTCSPQSDRCA
jgi:hypothetical protein